MTTDSKKTSQSDELAGLEKRAQVLLQESAELLDGATRSRLNQARHAALDAVKRPARKSISWWLPAGAVAAAVLAVMLTLNLGTVSNEHDAKMAMAPVDELEIVTAEDSLEFYRDVEFYAWLDTVLEEEPEPSGA